MPVQAADVRTTWAYEVLQKDQPIDSLKQLRKNALVLTVLTGPIGGHRILLGTHPRVPALYALTLGGGFGVLPLIDFFVILFSKDLEKARHNDAFIFWLK